MAVLILVQSLLVIRKKAIDEYFVIGNATGHSIDSRHFGTIRKQQIIAQAMYKGGPKTGLRAIPLTATFSHHLSLEQK